MLMLDTLLVVVVVYSINSLRIMIDQIIKIGKHRKISTGTASYYYHPATGWNAQSVK